MSLPMAVALAVSSVLASDTSSRTRSEVSRESSAKRSPSDRSSVDRPSVERSFLVGGFAGRAITVLRRSGNVFFDYRHLVFAVRRVGIRVRAVAAGTRRVGVRAGPIRIARVVAGAVGASLPVGRGGTVIRSGSVAVAIGIAAGIRRCGVAGRAGIGLVRGWRRTLEEPAKCEPQRKGAAEEDRRLTPGVILNAVDHIVDRRVLEILGQGVDLRRRHVNRLRRGVVALLLQRVARVMQRLPNLCQTLGDALLLVPRGRFRLLARLLYGILRALGYLLRALLHLFGHRTARAAGLLVHRHYSASISRELQREVDVV